jgi:hypothetical protein
MEKIPLGWDHGRQNRERFSSHHKAIPARLDATQAFCHRVEIPRPNGSKYTWVPGIIAVKNGAFTIVSRASVGSRPAVARVRSIASVQVICIGPPIKIIRTCKSIHAIIPTIGVQVIITIVTQEIVVGISPVNPIIVASSARDVANRAIGIRVIDPARR